MPFYPEVVLDDLRDHATEIRDFAEDEEETVERYREALRDALDEHDAAPLRTDLGPDRYPGALPTKEWDENDSPVVGFDASAGWDNHEAVNEYAKDVLEGVTTIAADGSELGPTDEFTVPLGLVQVAWNANHHHEDGDYERARAIHHELGPLFRALFVETNPIPVKEAMRIRGYGPAHLRSPLTRLSDEHLDHLRDVLATLETEDLEDEYAEAER